MGCGDSKSTAVQSQPKTKKPTIVLYYFGFRARAEPIRLILHYNGTQFEDKRLTQEEWGAKKKSGEYCGHFGQMPWVEMDGEVISQSKALLRSAARLAGVLGDNAWDTAKADSLVDTMTEYLETMAGVAFYEGDDADEKKAEFVSVTLPGFLNRLEKTLEVNDGGKGFLVGSKVTHADFTLFSLAESFEKRLQEADKADCMDSYPLLQGHCKRMAALPTLQEYLKNRPDMPF